MICANCGTEIDGLYYKFLDNFLQIEYFDSDEYNRFCSKECAMEYTMLERMVIDDE